MVTQQHKWIVSTRECMAKVCRFEGKLEELSEINYEEYSLAKESQNARRTFRFEFHAHTYRERVYKLRVVFRDKCVQ